MLKRLFQRLFRSERSRPERGFAVDVQLQTSLEDLAKREKRPLDDVANDLLQQALGERAAAEARLAPWWELTLRQQQIAAMTCQGYTNQDRQCREDIIAMIIRQGKYSRVLSLFANLAGDHRQSELYSYRK